MRERRAAAEPHCLVVEDDRDVRECLGTMLESMGCQVAVARDGVDATNLLAGEISPDFILLDMTMPRLDGAGVLCWLETHRPDLLDRVVLMTGSVAGPAHNIWEQSHLPKLHKPMSWQALEQTFVTTANRPRDQGE